MPVKDIRRSLNFRLKESVIEAYDDMAHEYRLDRADVIRAHLTVGARHRDEVEALLRQMVEVK